MLRVFTGLVASMAVIAVALPPDPPFAAGGVDAVVESVAVAVDPELAVDTDGDGIFDCDDNCIARFNPRQYDSNGDGYGNYCDADLNNDCMVDFADLALFRQVFLVRSQREEDADFNGDGFINFADLAQFRYGFMKPPGPSGLTDECTISPVSAHPRAFDAVTASR